MMVYVISDHAGYIKIGSTNNIDARIKELQCGNARSLEVIRQYFPKNDRDLERFLHHYLKSFNVSVSALQSSEWYSEQALSCIDGLTIDELSRTTKTPVKSESIYRENTQSVSFLQEEIARLSTKLKRAKAEINNKATLISKQRQTIESLEREVNRLSSSSCAYLYCGEQPPCGVRVTQEST